MEYEYEVEMEEIYRISMFKIFKKILDDGFFFLLFWMSLTIELDILISFGV